MEHINTRNIQNRIVKHIAENGPSSPYDLHSKKMLELGNIRSAFQSLHSAGVIFPTEEKSEHGGRKFDFTQLGARYTLHRGNFDLRRAKSYWGRTGRYDSPLAGTDLDRFEKESGSEESSIREEMIRILLFDHSRGIIESQIFTQLGKIYQDHPAMDRFRDNPIIQNAVQRLRPSFVKSDLSPLNPMDNLSGAKRAKKFKSPSRL